MATQVSTVPTILQLKVTLKGSKPPIWRRIQVTSTTTLAKLHAILQVVMGWEDAHLHQFTLNTTRYSDPTSNLEDTANERHILLSQLNLEPKVKFCYDYDFGDGWTHDIVVEKIVPPEDTRHYPVCLAGKQACPPEDCGGIWGYASLLETIADPDHPDYQAMREWLPGDFDPTAFDLEAINKALGAFR